MLALLRTMKAVRRLPSNERAAALSAALDAAILPAQPDTGDLDSIAAEAIPVARSKRGEAVLMGLMTAWPHLSQPARTALLAQAGDMIGAAATRMASDPADRRRHVAAALAADAAAGRLGPQPERPATHWIRLVERLLADQAQSVRLAAARAAADLAELIAPDDEPAQVAMDSVLAAAMSLYPEHRSERIVRAVAKALPNAGPALSEWLRSEDDAGQLALRGSAGLRSVELEPLALLRWLAIPALAGQAIERLNDNTEIQGGLEPVIELGHLLTGAHRAALRRIIKPKQLLDASRSMNEAARRGSLRWAAALPVDQTTRIAHIASLLGDPSTPVRLAAVRALGDERTNADARDPLFDFALDADPRVAAAAAAILAHMPDVEADRDRARWTMLERSPHASVRHRAQVIAARLDPWRCTASARRAMRRDRVGWLSAFAATRDMPPGRILDRLAIVDRLGVAGEIETLLIEFARSTEARVVAKAIGCLKQVRGGRVDAAIEAGLGHEDPRVRAAAIEAMAARSHSKPALNDFAQDTHARTRANAIASLLEHHDPKGPGALASMLRDARPDHRRSAIWVAERALPAGIARELAEMIQSEEDSVIRVRAIRCARRLLLCSGATQYQRTAQQEAMIA